MDYIESATAEQHLIDKDSQLGIALELKTNMLNQMEFVDRIPEYADDGQAQVVSKQVKTRFSINSASRISGSVIIDKLSGLFRLLLASPTNLSHQQQKVRVSGRLRLEQGEVLVYAPIDTDLWQMASVFAEQKESKRPKNYDLIIKGFKVYRVLPNQELKFNSELLTMGGHYYMIIAAAKPATGIEIRLA